MSHVLPYDRPKVNIWSCTFAYRWEYILQENSKKKNFVHDNYGKSPTLAGIMEPGC